MTEPMFNLSTTYNYNPIANTASNIINSTSIGSKVTNGIKNVVKAALFMENLRSINWSRGYCWYAELDGVPNPFHRGGVIGLPIKDIQFKISEGASQDFRTSAVETLRVPRTMGELGSVSLSLFDDEQQTLARFFERWYNQIYNPYKGVLPVTEACKQITIYKQKSTRRNLKRVYYNIDRNNSGVLGKINSYITGGKTTEGFDFLVYPDGPLQFNWATDANDLNSLTLGLQIVQFVNQDFGNPILTQQESAKVANNINSIVNDGTSFLNKLANFI